MLANRSTLIFVAFSHSAQDLAETGRVAHVEVRLGRARSRGLAWTDCSVGADVEAPHWSVSVAALLTALAAVDEVAQRSQLLEKKLAKVLVEDCVDDGVESGAEVAEPEEDLEHERVKVAAGHTPIVKLTVKKGAQQTTKMANMMPSTLMAFRSVLTLFF